MAKSSHIAIARQKRSMREARQLKEIMARQRTGLIPGDGIVPGDEAPVRPVTTTTTPRPIPPTTTPVRVVTTATTTTPVVRVTVRPTTSPAVVVPPASTSSPVPVRSTTPTRGLPSSTSLVPTSQAATSSKPKARATNTVPSASISASASALPSESGSTSTGALAGGVIGGIALLALLSFGIVYYMRRFQKRKQTIAFEASSFRRSAILLDDSKSETKSNGGASSSPMQEKYISHTDHAFAPQFQFPTNATKASVYGDTGYDQQGYLRGQENNVRLDTALPPPPVATSASPWGTAALVSAAAYGNSAYGMNSAPSPYSPYSQKHTQPDQQPPPPLYNDRDNMQATQTLSRQPSPPSTVMVREREQPPPSPVYGMHGQYVDLTRGPPIPPPTMSKPPTIRRKFFVQNPTPEPEETPSPSQPSSQPRNNAQQAVATDRKRPDTVYSTIYNPEDAYGGF
ncbi:hypothetical protein PTI98_008090 [Pleurotus ostreatus]|nr:hypothetical protein PTI98_008090 [Pleurotus ostreatus]